MAVRLSTLAEIKAFSLRTFAQGANANGESYDDILTALDAYKTKFELGNDPLGELGGADGLFKTIGLARSVRITEDYGTQNYYGIGSPKRPRIVPNNLSVTANVERIQLDTRDLNDYFSSPEYWYSNQTQARIGADDHKLYSYFFVKSKEDRKPTEVYALMPRTSQKAVTSQNVMVIHTVDLIGYKINYDEFFETILNETFNSDGLGVVNGAAGVTGSFPPQDEGFNLGPSTGQEGS